MRRLLIEGATEQACVSIVVSLLEELRTHAGATQNELPAPGAHANRELLDSQVVESLPVNFEKDGGPRDRKIVVIMQPLAQTIIGPWTAV